MAMEGGGMRVEGAQFSAATKQIAHDLGVLADMIKTMRDVKLGRKDFDDVQKAAVRSEQALKDKLKGLEAELKQGVAEEASQRRMDSQLQDYREGYTKAHAELKEARLQAETRLKSSDREQLLAGGEVELQRRAAVCKENEAKAAKETTNKLQRALGMLEEGAEAGGLSAAELQSSMAKLKGVGKTMEDMGADLNTSKKVVAEFSSQAFYDWLWIGAAFMLYLATLVYITSRRVGINYLVSWLTGLATTTRGDPGLDSAATVAAALPAGNTYHGGEEL